MTCPTCHSALGRREIAISICSSPWHDRAVQPPATPQEPSGAQLALADIERAYSETEVALAQVVSRNDKELFFNGDKALRAHLQKNLDYYRIRRDGVRALLAPCGADTSRGAEMKAARIGDWIRYQRDGRLVVGVVAYIRPRAAWDSTPIPWTVEHGPVEPAGIVELRSAEEQP